MISNTSVIRTVSLYAARLSLVRQLKREATSRLADGVCDTARIALGSSRVTPCFLWGGNAVQPYAPLRAQLRNSSKMASQFHPVGASRGQIGDNLAGNRARFSPASQGEAVGHG